MNVLPGFIQKYFLYLSPNTSFANNTVYAYIQLIAKNKQLTETWPADLLAVVIRQCEFDYGCRSLACHPFWSVKSRRERLSSPSLHIYVLFVQWFENFYALRFKNVFVAECNISQHHYHATTSNTTFVTQKISYFFATQAKILEKKHKYIFLLVSCSFLKY